MMASSQDRNQSEDLPGAPEPGEVVPSFVTSGERESGLENYAPMPSTFFLVMTNRSSKDWVAQLTSSPQILGRSRDSDITVPCTCHSVSRKHAVVWHDRDWAWICDRNSTFGTWINGVRLISGRNTKVDRGDRIRLGTSELMLVDEAQLRANVLFDDVGPVDSTDDTFKMANGGMDLLPSQLEPLSLLSHAERDIILWMSRRHTRPEDIGRMLHRSPHTVRTQLNSIFRKLNVHSRDELLGFVLRGRQQMDCKETI